MITLVRTTASYDPSRDGWRVLSEFRDGTGTIWVDGEWTSDTTPEQRTNATLRLALGETNAASGLLNYSRGTRI